MVLLLVLLFVVGPLWGVEGHRLHSVMGLVRGFLGSLAVKEPLALLHGPLQLSCKDPHVVVALEAIAVREDVDNDLGG